MDGLPTLDIALSAAGTFAAALIWLHVPPPVQAAPVIVAFALRSSVPKLRRAVKLAPIWPFVPGSGLGMPHGTELRRGGPSRSDRPATVTF